MDNVLDYTLSNRLLCRVGPFIDERAAFFACDLVRWIELVGLYIGLFFLVFSLGSR